jgi:hypothetical protein
LIRYLTATELLTFVHAYAAIFQDEESRFPKVLLSLFSPPHTPPPGHDNVGSYCRCQ